MWEEKGYARNMEPGERPIMMNKQLAEAIREAHEGKPALLNQMLDELRAQITDKKECESFFKNFRQAYLKSENYSKARKVLDVRDIPTSEIFKKMKEGDKSLEAEYGRRINGIVEAGNGLWSGRQTANLLSAYTHFNKMDEDKKSKTGQEPPADSKVEVIVGYLQTGVEKANQDKFAEALSKKDGLPCGENLSKDIADVAKALRSAEVGEIPPMNERERHTGVRDPQYQGRRQAWQDVKDAAAKVPAPIKEALARRNSPSNDLERNAQIAGPKGFLDGIGHVIDADNVE